MSKLLCFILGHKWMLVYGQERSEQGAFGGVAKIKPYMGEQCQRCNKEEK